MNSISDILSSYIPNIINAELDLYMGIKRSLSSIQWCDFDRQPHRYEGPAHIEFHRNGTIKWVAWKHNGGSYRKDGPHTMMYYDTGQIEAEKYNDGLLNKIVSFYENGQIRDEKYFQNNKLHKSNGPALITYYRTGKIREEQWLQHGLYIQSDKPNYIEYYEDGRIKCASQY